MRYFSTIALTWMFRLMDVFANISGDNPRLCCTLRDERQPRVPSAGYVDGVPLPNHSGTCYATARMDQLRHLRESRHLTQVQLGLLLGVQPAAVGRWERGGGDPTQADAAQSGAPARCHRGRAGVRPGRGRGRRRLRSAGSSSVALLIQSWSRSPPSPGGCSWLSLGPAIYLESRHLDVDTNFSHLSSL
jgi:DNA-binding XRE family transcriptional regulator